MSESGSSMNQYKHGDTRCYSRNPDGYIIEVGQSKPDFTYG
jgi:hypothetical protein